VAIENNPVQKETAVLLYRLRHIGLSGLRRLERETEMATTTMPHGKHTLFHHDHAASHTDALQGTVVFLGRFFFSLIFLMEAPNHFSEGTITFAAAQSIPLASIAVPLSGIIALAGALSVLLGYHTKIGAWLLVLFLVLETLMMHTFWAVSDSAAAQIQMIMFLQNVSMLGGALLITEFGAGQYSFDARHHVSKEA
jgi:putative oxidoreductase